MSGLRVQGIPGGSSGKEPPANARGSKRLGLTLWVGMFLGKLNSYPFSILNWRILWTERRQRATAHG